MSHLMLTTKLNLEIDGLLMKVLNLDTSTSLLEDHNHQP